MPKTTKPKSLSPVKKLLNRFRPDDPGAVWQRAAQTSVVVTIIATLLTVFGATNDSWQLPKLFVLLVGTTISWLLFFVMHLRRGTTNWKWHPLDLLVGLFVLAIGISAATSVQWWKSVFGISGWRDQSFVMIVCGALLYFLLGKLFTNAQARMLVWWAILGSIASSLLIHLFQLAGFSAWPEPWHSQVWFNVLDGSPRQLSVLAAFFSTAMMIITVSVAHRWSRWMAFTGVLLGWIFLLFLGQAIGWAMIAVGMMFVILQATRQKNLPAIWMIVAVVIAVSGMVAQMTKLADHSAIARPYEVTLDQRTSSHIALTTVLHRPVLGSGPATWYEDFVKYRDVAYNATDTWNLRFQQAGSSWLQTFATFGVIGTILFLGILAFGVWAGWTTWQKSGDVWALLSLNAAIFIFLTGWFTTWSFALIVIYWVSLGVTRAGLLEAQKAKSKPYAPFQMLAEVAVIFVMIFACIPLASITASDVATRNAQRWFDTIVVGKTAENAKAISQATSWLQRAVRWDEHNNTALLLLANTQAIQVKQDVDQNNLTDAGVALQAMQTTLTTATQRFGHDPITYETANNLLNILSSVLQNAVADAKKNFAALRSIEPNNPIQDVGYGQVLMVERGQLIGSQTSADEKKAESLLTEALASYDAAIAKKPTYFQAHYARAQALVSGERYQEALDEMPLDQTAAASQVALTYQVRAQAYAGLKKDELAVASFKSAINAYSKDSLSYILFSEYYKNKKNTAAAKKVLEDGLVALPKDAQLLAAQKALTSN